MNISRNVSFTLVPDKYTEKIDQNLGGCYLTFTYQTVLGYVHPWL